MTAAVIPLSRTGLVVPSLVPWQAAPRRGSLRVQTTTHGHRPERHIEQRA